MGATLESEPVIAKGGGAAAAGLGPGERSTVAGRYKLLELLAQGGMGSVYRAEHLLSRKKLAVKVVHPYLCKGRQGVERFRREVSAAAEIDHPGIVQVYDAGVDEDGGFFMAMELLSGESLGDLLRRDWPGMASAVNIVVGILEPLAKAHEKGFVHRDLKPDNIFLTQDDAGRQRVKLLDFGLAREVDKGGPTRTGITFGTPEYMSPEQAISARQVKSPGDVWSVGVMLYELLSGEHPFSGETPNAIMANAIKEPLPPLEQRAPHVPAPLVQVIEQSLQKKPEDRPQSAAEMLEELRAVLAQVTLDETVPSATRAPPVWNESSDSPEGSLDLPIIAPMQPPTSPSEAAARVMAKGARRNRIIASVAGFMALVIAVAAGAAVFFALDAPPQHAATAVVTEAPDTPELVAPAEPAEPAEAPLPQPAQAAEPMQAEAALEVAPAPEPERGTRPRRREPEPREGRPSALDEARGCLARGDRRCARDILAARARTAGERALLIDIYRELGQIPQMLDAMEVFVRRFPNAPQTPRYRDDLRRYGRL